MKRRLVVAVIGAGDAQPAVCKLAFEVGREIAHRGAVLINGGLAGVMESAAAGARKEGGHTIGIIPGYDRHAANRHIEFAIATASARLATLSSSRVRTRSLRLRGEGGTLAEIGFALKFGKPVVALDSWPEIAD